MVAGPYCGKLLADLGADVVKVEPPEGDPARQAGPFPPSGPDPECSAMFLYLNTSKRGIVVDLGSPAGTGVLRRLLGWADVCIDGLGVGRFEALGLDWPALSALNPRLVYTSITPYGRSGPRATVGGDELTLIHAGGLGNLLPTRSESIERAPVKMGGHPVGYHGGLAAALATLAAVIGRRLTGRGRCIDISLQEVVLSLVRNNLAGSRYQGTTWSRVPDRPPAMGRMRTRDGYIVIGTPEDHHFRAFRELLGNPDWLAGREWESLEYRIHHLMEVTDRLDAWMAQQGKHEMHHRAARQGIAAGPINSVADVLADEQYAARGYFRELAHPRAGTLRYPGWPYRMTATPPGFSRAAPRLGEHTDAVCAGVGYTVEEVRELRQRGVLR